MNDTNIDQENEMTAAEKYQLRFAGWHAWQNNWKLLRQIHVEVDAKIDERKDAINDLFNRHTAGFTS